MYEKTSQDFLSVLQITAIWPTLKSRLAWKPINHRQVNKRYSGMLQESVVATLHDGSAYTEVQSQCIYVNQHPACLLANAQGLLVE